MIVLCTTQNINFTAIFFNLPSSFLVAMNFLDLLSILKMYVIIKRLTFKLEFNVGIGVAEGVEGVASVQPLVGQARLLDREGQEVLVLARLLSLIAHPDRSRQV